MTRQRWIELWSGGELTPEEIADGWHFCPEMDGLLANCKDPYGDCFCERQPERKNEQIVLPLDDREPIAEGDYRYYRPK